MAKFYGAIGFASTEETESGIWEEVVTEYMYTGDIINTFFKSNYNQDSTNSDIKLTNKISIIGDVYALSNYSKIVYVEYMGAKWQVTEVSIAQPPRLILSVGGVYHENSE